MVTLSRIHNYFLLFIVVQGLAFDVFASGLSCSVVFSKIQSQYSYLDAGATGVAFVRGGRVHKVPIDPEASNYFINEGYLVARHEAMLLTTFHQLIREAQISEFRPLDYVEAQKLKDPNLIEQFNRQVPKDQWGEDVIVNGVLISEFVVGRTLYDVLMDPTTPPEVARSYAEKFLKAINKIEAHLASKNSSFERVNRGRLSVNRVYEDDPNFVIPAIQMRFPWALSVDLAAPRGALQTDFSFYLSPGSNILIDSNGKFVLIDPN